MQCFPTVLLSFISISENLSQESFNLASPDGKLYTNSCSVSITYVAYLSSPLLQIRYAAAIFPGGSLIVNQVDGVAVYVYDSRLLLLPYSVSKFRTQKSLRSLCVKLAWPGSYIPNHPSRDKSTL